jgi:hypothetical protein
LAAGAEKNSNIPICSQLERELRKKWGDGLMVNYWAQNQTGTNSYFALAKQKLLPRILII